MRFRPTRHRGSLAADSCLKKLQDQLVKAFSILYRYMYNTCCKRGPGKRPIVGRKSWDCRKMGSGFARHRTALRKLA